MMPRAIKNPLAVLDPFTLSPQQTRAHSMVWPTLERWSFSSSSSADPPLDNFEEDNNRNKMKNLWYVRPEMYFGEALVFNSNVSYHTAVKDIAHMGDVRKSIESRVVVVDTCLLEMEGTFSLAKLQKLCWGKLKQPASVGAGAGVKAKGTP
eukprot:g1249.t1